MAKGSAKRAAANNVSALRTLAVGFVLANTVHIVLTFAVYKVAGWRPVMLYASTEAVAITLAIVLIRMASAGQDLAQDGLTAYVPN